MPKAKEKYFVIQETKERDGERMITYFSATKTTKMKNKSVQ